MERQLESLQSTGDWSGTGLVEQQLSGRCTELKTKKNKTQTFLCDADTEFRSEETLMRRFATCHAHN